MGIGLAAFWAALGRSTLYPVGPQRVPDHHPTCVGHARPGERDPSLQRHCGPGGTPVHAAPASSQAACCRCDELGQTRIASLEMFPNVELVASSEMLPTRM